MFKRMIEREYSDLFPHEPTFICAKLEDEFGYSLSNSSFVYELLKPNDRLFAIPELFTKDLIGKMHLTHDLNELTFMQKSITQTIVAKLAGIFINILERLIWDRHKHNQKFYNLQFQLGLLSNRKQ